MKGGADSAMKEAFSVYTSSDYNKNKWFNTYLLNKFSVEISISNSVSSKTELFF